jgi:hypothetical protein
VSRADRSHRGARRRFPHAITLNPAFAWLPMNRDLRRIEKTICVFAMSGYDRASFRHEQVAQSFMER